MSELGVKTGKAQREHMFSALPLKPDLAEYGRHVRLVPIPTATLQVAENLAERQVIDSIADVATTFAQQGVTLTCRCSSKPSSFES